MPESAGAIVSVNVGQPRDVQWNGRTVRTAIFKSPVEGRVWAGRLNLAGDGQADLKGHGGEQRAIMVYQMESYRHWAAHFGRDDFVMGQFGENLTVEGLPDRDVCIGDRFRIGGAIVEVSQPRVTCYKVGLRLGDPQMAALLVAHKRPGFYFRVVQEGEIGAGDAIEKIADGPEALSVVDMDGLLYSSDHPRPMLERALKIPALSPGWRQSMQNLARAADSGAVGNAGLAGARSPIAWPGLKRLRIVEAAMVSADVRAFTLADPDGSVLPDFQAGQNIVVRVAPPGGAPVSRNYSLCGPGGTGRFRIAVKREPHGAASGFLHDHVALGDCLSIGAPRGTFLLVPGTSPLVLISAGVGITPMLAMLHAATAEGAPDRPIWWLHATRDKAHLGFIDEIRTLAARRPVKVRTIFSQPGARDRPGADFDLAGRLDQATLAAQAPPKDGDVYMCGPMAFMDAVAAALTAYGVPDAGIRREAFGPLVQTLADRPPPHPPEGKPGDGPCVSFLRSGLTVPWDVRFGSLLDLAEACDVPVRWSCRTGVCHNCESGLVDGDVGYAPDPIDPPPAGQVLICCARPRGEIELDL